MKSARWLQLRGCSAPDARACLLLWRGVAWRGVALGSESFMSAFSGALSKLLVQSHRVVTFFCDEGV